MHSIEYLGAGALVGELGVLLGEPRSATLRAVRDAELIHVPRETFLSLSRLSPRSAPPFRACSRGASSGRPNSHEWNSRVRTVALLPVDGRPVPAGFVRSFLDALTARGRHAVVSVERASRS